MKRLVVFGDSFSNSWERIVNYIPFSYQTKYAQEFYDKHQHYPIHFSDILKEEFGFDEVVNNSRNGSDNYSIMESIGNEIGNINDNDFVLIGWSDITRWRHIDDNNLWYINYIEDTNPNQNPDDIRNLKRKPKPYKDIPFMEYQSLLRNTPLTIKELESWQYILTKAIKNVFFWTPFYFENLGNIPFVTNIRREESGTITEETHGEIVDDHWGGTGHEIIGKWLCKQINNKNKIL